MKSLHSIPDSMPPLLREILASLFSLLAGVAVAMLFSYVLYRIGLPGKPFIYVSF